ncbi:PHP domain-containing protein [Desulfotalea psychrophila]|uniref:Polymerase/histidinol phosphatase N-terminal domain-containing protein n=1 Tax=Desulfotalea psychrophila (strain LSv54 / DSM 12343) TaxID=177439 RepID=Q6AL10_DESPS|nr:PHP domain-containing protein [Desulfotalea psychrophila]CAG36965.1 hypothetical protein DP2236 [Desulfotalea psychrophila LSv54]
MSIDLHVHSSFSDGSMTPTELVELAKRKGLHALSITDHDNILSVSEALCAGKQYGLTVFSGVELSLVYNGMDIHLLSYLFDQNNFELQTFLAEIQESRATRNGLIIKSLLSLGVKITAEEERCFLENRQLGRPHIAKLLVRKAVVKNMKEAFALYLTPGKPAYVPRKTVPIQRAIDVLHRAGGVTVLAHPFNMNRGDRDLFEVIGELGELGVDGVEAYYPTHSRKRRDQLLGCARENNLICTGGSDYHGNFRAGTQLAGGKNVCVPEELLTTLYLRKERYSPVQDENKI